MFGNVTQVSVSVMPLSDVNTKSGDVLYSNDLSGGRWLRYEITRSALFRYKTDSLGTKGAVIVACGFTAIDYPTASATISGITSHLAAYFVMYVYSSYEPDTMKRRKQTLHLTSTAIIQVI